MRATKPATLAQICALLVCSAASSNAAPPVPAAGEGILITGFAADGSDTTAPFKPTHATAFRTAKPERVWLLLTESDTAKLDWAGSDTRIRVLQTWCKDHKTPYVLFELNLEGTPELVHECSGTGFINTAMISNFNGLASVVPAYDAFERDRIRGSIKTGRGSCGDRKYCDATGSYTFDVAVKDASSAR